MGTSELPNLPGHSFIFIDANIFVYGLSGQSGHCRQFLDRCLKEEVTGITLFETVNEVTRRLMVAEALSKGLITRATAKRLRENADLIPRLSDYWKNIERLLALNLLFVPVNGAILRGAHAERHDAGLLTNDSMIVSCMREYGVSFLATNDADFERVSGITVFKPVDVP
ncbi:MAG TPA: type II toxin-antitoxin system VapC family toxin [Terriglobia bacterium]|nr:type II toxin-antitoxin system VapC family toxin [Terriglobia bacterium]